jgi:DNA-directed RNA polymerase subunit K/omega
MSDSDEEVFTEVEEEEENVEEEEEEVLEEEIEDRNSTTNIVTEIIKGKPDTCEFITLAEKAAIISLRAEQIERGSRIFAKGYMKYDNAIDIAKLELEQGRTPLAILRKVRETSEGSIMEKIPVKKADIMQNN